MKIKINPSQAADLHLLNWRLKAEEIADSILYFIITWLINKILEGVKSLQSGSAFVAGNIVLEIEHGVLWEIRRKPES